VLSRSLFVLGEAVQRGERDCTRLHALLTDALAPSRKCASTTRRLSTPRASKRPNVSTVPIRPRRSLPSLRSWAALVSSTT